MTIQEAQSKVDHWIQTYGVRYFSELTNTAILTEEVGEVARLMARIYGDQSFKKETSPDEAHQQLSDEIADVMFVLISIANQCNIDLETALYKNLEKKTNRDSDRHHQNPKLQ